MATGSAGAAELTPEGFAFLFFLTGREVCAYARTDPRTAEGEASRGGIGQNGVEHSWITGGPTNDYPSPLPDYQPPRNDNSWAVQQVANSLNGSNEMEPPVFSLQSVGPTTCDPSKKQRECTEWPVPATSSSTTPDCAYDNTEIFEYLAQHYYPNSLHGLPPAVGSVPTYATAPRTGASVDGPTDLELYYADLDTAAAEPLVADVLARWINHNHAELLSDPLNPNNVAKANPTPCPESSY